MRAIKVEEFGGPEVLKLSADVDKPSPKENEVLIHVKAVGVNPLETYVRSGLMAPEYMPSLPYIPGSDLAGVVEAVGSAVTDFKVGDRVFTSPQTTAAYAEYAVANEAFTFKLDDKLTFAQGASVGIPYLTAYKSYMVAGAKPGDKVLVHGASGAVGLAACQIGKGLGLKVIGTAGTDEGLKLVRENGAEAAYNHREDGYIDQVKAWAGEGGINIILEMVANANLSNDIDLMAPKGRIMVIGSRGGVTLDPMGISLKEVQVIGSRGGVTLDPMGLLLKEVQILGIALLAATNDEMKGYGNAIVKGMKEGWVTPMVGVEYDLVDAPKAHDEVMSHSQGTKGKIVLKV